MAASDGRESSNMHGDLEQQIRNREISEFLLRACHDLKAPVRAIYAHAELLLRNSDDALSSSHVERLGFIRDGARRIDLLVEGLSRYSLALQIQPHSFLPTHLEVLLRLVLGKLEAELSRSGTRVTYDPLPRVSGNPDWLSQVLENLVLNSVNHRGSSLPEIHVSAERRPGEYLIAVKDNGPGIENIYLERIFKPFERLCGKDYPGPGLGLAICRAIIEIHGGKIWAESSPGGGASFFFTLPFPALPTGS